jgi:transcriptional regulator with XRE-family HTH domain
MTEAGPSAIEPLVGLGIRLKRVRERSGKSLREVARQLGVSASFVSQLENGKSQPSVATLYSLTQLLEVSVDELFAADGRYDAPPAAALDDAVPAPAGPAAEPIPVPQGAPIAQPAAAAVGGAGEPVNRSALSMPDVWPREPGLARLSITRPGERHVLEMDSGVIWERLVDNTGTGLDFIEIIYPPHSSSTNDKRMLRHTGSEFGWLMDGELEITVGFEVVTLHAGEAIGFDSSTPHLLANKTDRVARGIWVVRHD